MVIKQKIIKVNGIKFFIEQDGREIARAYLYILVNGSHDQPFGFMEDVYVEESLRGQGIGTELVNKIIAAAKENNCYKIVATSRHSRDKVHELYKRLGFEDWGKEFRMEL